MEHSFHRFPFLCGTHSGCGLLEDSHIFFPLLLAGKGVQAFHCRVPVKIKGSFDDLKQSGSQDINFHFQDANFPDTGKNFRPCFRLAMSFPIVGD